MIPDPGSPTEEARYRAVRALSPDAPDTLPALIERLSDESWRVRKAAVERLAELRPVERTVPALIAALGLGDDVQARNAAAEALARMGVPAARALVERLGHADADVRKFAADILGELGCDFSIDALAASLDDCDRNVRAAAAEALGKVGGARAAVALERVLRADDHLLRVSALDGLSRIGAVPQIEALERLARDRFLRRPVYRLLGRHSGARALTLLLDGLSDPGRSTRDAALAGIAEQARRATGFFWGRLVVGVSRAAGGPAPMRAAAREALGRDEPAAVEGAMLLLGALRDVDLTLEIATLGGSERFRDAARLALAAMGERVEAPLARGLASLRPESLALASEFLGDDHNPQLSERALSAIDEASPELAAELLELLGALGGPESVEGLLARMDDPLFGDQARRALGAVAARHRSLLAERADSLWSVGPSPATLFLLGAVGGASSWARVRAALKHSDAAMRVAAVRALTSGGDPDAADAVAAAITDESDDVRAASVRALGALDFPDLARVIEGALADLSPRVARAAAEVSASAHLTSVVPALSALVDRGGGAAALAAIEAIERLGALDLQMLERASEHAHAEVSRAALERASGRAGGMALLRARLAHPRWEVRRAAARVAGRVGDLTLGAELRARLITDDDPLVIEALHQAIAAIASREP